MSEIFVYIGSYFELIRAFVAAYVSVVGGFFVSVLPFSGFFGACLFATLNLLLFLWIFGLIFRRENILKNPFSWACAGGFGISVFYFSDFRMQVGIFCLFLGIYFCFTKDSQASLKIFEKLRFKFANKRR